jgi:hypothetical protein
MSEEKKAKKEEQEVKTEERRENVLVQVDRSRIEKELQDKLEKEAVEKSKLNDQLLTYQKQLEELKQKDEAKTKEYDEILKERDETKGKLQEIAMAKFNEVKTARLKMLQDSGLPEEKIKEFNDKIKTPKDLDEMDFVLKILGEQFAKRQAEDEKKTEEDQKKGAADARKINPQDPPKGSVVGLPPVKTNSGKIYETPREAIDTLYEKVAKGDKEAEKDLNALWSKFIPTLKKQRMAFGVAECPTCGAGILEGEKCWMCGFDPAKWRSTGGEIF